MKFTLKVRQEYFEFMHNNFFIEQELYDLGVRFEVVNSNAVYLPTGKISIEGVELRNLGVVVSLFNQLEDYIK